MNQAIQTEDLNKAIEAECKKYFFHQKENILSNIRTYAKYDNEINFFLDKVIAEVRKEFEEEKKIIRNDLKEEFKKWKVQYQEDLKSGIKKLHQELEEQSQKIVKREPYDILSKAFMNELRKEWRNEFDEKITNVYMWFLFLVFGIIGFHYYFNQ